MTLLLIPARRRASGGFVAHVQRLSLCEANGRVRRLASARTPQSAGPSLLLVRSLGPINYSSLIESKLRGADKAAAIWLSRADPDGSALFALCCPGQGHSRRTQLSRPGTLAVHLTVRPGPPKLFLYLSWTGTPANWRSLP